MTAAVNQRAGMLVVEQLNHAQWHVVDAAGDWHSGVTSWPHAVSNALWTAILTGRGVESVGLYGERLVLVRPGVGA